MPSQTSPYSPSDPRFERLKDLASPIFTVGLFLMSIGEQRQALRALYPTTPNKDLSKMLGMSVGMVQRYSYQMGLKKDPKYLSEVNRKCGMKSSSAKKWKCK